MPYWPEGCAMQCRGAGQSCSTGVNMLALRPSRLGGYAAVAVTALAMLVGCSSDAAPAPSADPSVDGELQLDDAGIPVLSDARAEAELRAQAESLAEMVRGQYPDAGLPEVSVLRVVTPDEQLPLLVDCLNEQGFSVTLEDDGYSSQIPVDQGEAYAIATYVCQASYPVDPRYTMPLTTGELETVYRYYVDVQMPCLASQGVALTDEPPSLQQFIDSSYAQGWIPYSAVGNVSQSTWERLNEACPQEVPGLRQAP
jgi:hypothetical protein